MKDLLSLLNVCLTRVPYLNYVDNYIHICTYFVQFHLYLLSNV